MESLKRLDKSMFFQLIAQKLVHDTNIHMIF